MEREVETLGRVVGFLKQHGYPEEAIILEWKISNRLRVDMAVIDPHTKRPVALFEFKRTTDSTSDAEVTSRLKKYAEVIGDPTIPLYVIYTSDSPPFYKIFILSQKDGNEILRPIFEVPSFAYFKNSSISRLLSQKEREKNRTYDGFRIICWLLAFLVVGLLCLDVMGCVQLTAERLGIIAIIVGLTIVPFARKLSILGVEFERLQDGTKVGKS